VVNQYGNLTFTAVKGINVIDIDQQTLHDAWAFTITGPADATVLINVLNAAVNLDNTTWVYQGGIAESSVVLNMPLATSLTLSQGNAVNILAPLATTQFQQGTVNGQLVVGNLYGGGVVTGGSFNDHALPEPATLSLLALGTLAIMRRRRK
jgi:choice-of-anchor A domain-containing protein